jgi:hypothetical protein
MQEQQKIQQAKVTKINFEKKQKNLISGNQTIKKSGINRY